MFSKIGPMEIVLILVVVLLIFGPAKLPQLGKSVGEGIKEFKKSFSGGGRDDESADKSDKTDGEKKS